MVLIMSFCFTSCNKQKTDNAVNENLQKHYQSDEFYYDYKTNHYKFRLPKFWKGKYNVSVLTHREDFYEVNSFNKDETGLLFSILEYEDESYKTELDGKNYTYLCYDKRFELHYIFLLPDEEIYPEEFAQDYNALKEGVHIAKATFKAEL